MVFNKITFHYFGRKGRTGKQGDGSLYQPPISVTLPSRNFSLIMIPGGPCCSLRPTSLPLVWALASQICYFQLWPQRAVPNHCDLIESCTEVLTCLFFPVPAWRGEGFCLVLLFLCLLVSINPKQSLAMKEQGKTHVQA